MAGLRATSVRAAVVSAVGILALAACGPVGDDGFDEADDGPESANGVDSDGDQDGDDDRGDGDNGDGDDGGPVVVGAPFRIPSISELSLSGEEVAQRIRDSCEAAQRELPESPDGPCVEVVFEQRPDPEREPGQYIESVPPGGDEVEHGATVTVVVADDDSPTGGEGGDPAGEGDDGGP